jgi:hypothetical protein
MPRLVPEPLYSDVLALVAAIAQPDVRSPDSFDQTLAVDAYRRLNELHRHRETMGEPDPFLTEALADMTDDSTEAIRLYLHALEQCLRFPGEPVVTKRIGLARRLLSEGREPEALRQIDVARREAFSERDIESIKEIDGLLDAEAI